ncbi:MULTISPECIES: glycosyltransferase family 4 protein [unclassified Agarivorans]|uniref:glycosyltransferase family 4 protein n=1 Tax=unclassified Agarivorans TaxID=2636026 RepID=UPI003D7D2D59
MQTYRSSDTPPQTQAIWLFIDSQTVGGIESHVVNLAQALAKRRHPVCVVLWRAYQPDHPMLAQLNQHQVAWLVLDGSIRTLRRALNDYSPCVVHSHGYKASIVARLVRLFQPIRLVSSFHAGEACQGRLALYDFADRYSAWLSQQRIAVSQSIASRVAASCQVINNFVELPAARASLASVNRSPTIALVGRLTQVKGPDRFYDLAKALPQFDFAVYGEGDWFEQANLPPLANLVFHGRKSSMSNHWANIDLLCMPSRHEGLPLAALEAMARGIPVMATNVGALGQLIQHRVNGFLFEQFQRSQWRDCLLEWQHSTQLQHALSARARLTVAQHYSAEAVLPQFEALYRQLRQS